MRNLGYDTATTAWFLSIFIKVVFTVAGAGMGCIVGYFSAHHFALFGGFNLMGQPHSPARQALVPGHMALWALILGLAGFGLGFMLASLTRFLIHRESTRGIDETADIPLKNAIEPR